MLWISSLLSRLTFFCFLYSPVGHVFLPTSRSSSSCLVHLSYWVFFASAEESGRAASDNTDFKNRERGRLENMRTEGGLRRAPRFKRGKFVVKFNNANAVCETLRALFILSFFPKRMTKNSFKAMQEALLFSFEQEV